MVLAVIYFSVCFRPSICFADSNLAATNFSNLSQIIFALSTLLRLQNTSLYSLQYSGFHSCIFIYFKDANVQKGFRFLLLVCRVEASEIVNVNKLEKHIFACFPTLSTVKKRFLLFSGGNEKYN